MHSLAERQLPTEGRVKSPAAPRVSVRVHSSKAVSKQADQGYHLIQICAAEMDKNSQEKFTWTSFHLSTEFLSLPPPFEVWQLPRGTAEPTEVSTNVFAENTRRTRTVSCNCRRASSFPIIFFSASLRSSQKIVRQFGVEAVTAVRFPKWIFFPALRSVLTQVTRRAAFDECRTDTFLLILDHSLQLLLVGD